MPFNHNEGWQGVGVATWSDPYAPWAPGQSPVHTGGQVAMPASVVQAGLSVSWGSTFNAIHMSLIPKGRYRGMVLVWDRYPLVAKDPTGFAVTPPLSANQYRSFQPYSIIDPSEMPTVVDPLFGVPIRYRNFYLPIGVIDPTQAPLAQDLFCSGHAWSPFADLLVAGGTDFFLHQGVLNSGGISTFAFNPALAVANYPTTAQSMYPGFRGLWVKGPDMEGHRWYPTVTMTHRLQRVSGAPGATNLPAERMVILGGSEDDPLATPGVVQSTWNSYEALVVEAGATQFSSGLKFDSVPLFPGHKRTFDGPGTSLPTPTVEQDWFEEYPRCHLLSTGRLFFSGYAPRWASVDHDLNPGAWIRAVGPTFSSNWHDPRHDGSSVLFPNFGGQQDTVMRLGGASDHEYFTPLDTTESVEYIAASSSSANWQAAARLPDVDGLGDGGRFHLNTVLLPNGDVLVLGGQRAHGSSFQPVRGAAIYRAGAWIALPGNPILSPRIYHATAVLLPDGRVFFGGGEGRLYDYEIFSPDYMDMERPQNPVWQGTPPAVDSAYDAFSLGYGQEYELACDEMSLGVALDKVVLMAPCSTTHHSDMHQRYVEMKVSVTAVNKVTFVMPSQETVAPRGVYMLFLVANSGAPSEAMWVVLQ